jgi:hypothetical protein
VVPWLVDSSAALLGPLPPTSFRFVNFNQLFKVDPRTATGWGNVLRRTPGATLWQLSTPAAGAKRLKAEFRVSQPSQRPLLPLLLATMSRDRFRCFAHIFAYWPTGWLASWLAG